jgi:hypothetical protein
MIKIDSTNRTQAKRLLNTWFDSRAVRVMTLEQLNATLRRAINEGLITEQGAERALLPQSRRQDNYNNDGNGEQHERDHSNDDERDDNSNGTGGDDGDSDSDGDDGESQQEGESDNESDSESESESQQDDGEQGDGESDDESESQSDSESDSDSDSDSESDDDGQQEEQDDESQSEQEGDEQDSESDDEQEQESQSNDDDDDDEQDDGPLRHEMFPVVLKWIKAGLNVALVGPAGTGKSTIVGHVAEELGREFRGTGALMSKYDLVGYSDAAGVYHATPLYEAFTEGHLFCFDELDGSAPDAVVAFNAATDNQNVFAFPNGMQPKHDDFVAVACMNTWGNGASADYVGRYKQDAASMSRFVKVFIDYDRRIETVIAGKKHIDIAQRIWDLRTACTDLGIRHVVSTRMIQQAVAGRTLGKCTNAEIDRDVIFAGLDDGAIKQLQSPMNALKRARAANKRAAKKVSS